MGLAFPENTATIGSTEFYLGSNSTTKVDQTDDCLLQVWIDFVNMAAGDQYRVRIYEKVVTGGTQKTIIESIVSDAQSSPFVAPTLMMGVAWECGVTKISGTDRSISWSLRKAT